MTDRPLLFAKAAGPLRAFSERGFLEPLAVSIVALALLAVTVRCYGITTDEPRYVENNQRILQWFRQIPHRGLAGSLEPQVLSEGWYYARPDSKNLPLVSIVSTLGYVTVGRFDEPLAAWRWGNLLAFAATAGLVFAWARAELGRFAGLSAVLALVGTPRLLAHASLLGMDTLVASLWLWASWLLWRLDGSWCRALQFAAVCGIGCVAKVTFWFAIPLWCLWTAFARPGNIARVLTGLVSVTPFVAALLTPMWWPSPREGLLAYLDMLRNDPTGWAVDVFYFGRVYQTQIGDAVPWHSVIVLPLITTPVWILLLGGIGIVAGLRSRIHRGLTVLWLIGLCTLPAICGLPQTPAHDGLRLYRTAFVFLPLLTALGAVTVRRRLFPRTLTSTETHRMPFSRRLQLACMTVAIAVLAMWPTVRSARAGLSYYNILIGGLPGASSSFEVTYWWELADPATLKELQRSLPTGARFFTYPHQTGSELMHSWGYLRADVEHVVPERAQYVLISGRMGKLLGPTAAPDMTREFLQGQPLWERRVDGIRTLALFRLRGPLHSGR